MNSPNMGFIGLAFAILGLIGGAVLLRIICTKVVGLDPRESRRGPQTDALRAKQEDVALYTVVATFVSIMLIVGSVLFVPTGLVQVALVCIGLGSMAGYSMTYRTAVPRYYM